MASAYTPGLQLRENTRYRARRLLPIEGEVLVEQGQRVEARQVVARAGLPGDLVPINMANQLSLAPSDVPGCVKAVGRTVGDRIEPGDLLARTNGLFGFFKAEYVARTGGVIETISQVTGQVILRGESIPVERRAYVSGEVTEVLPRQGVVIEADVTYIQGIFGIGGEAYGPICLACKSWEDEVRAEHIRPAMRGAIVVGGARMTGESVHKAVETGVSALISGGIDDADLKEILGYDLGVAITGTEQIGTTLIITEGFGEIAMAQRTFELLRSREHSDAAVNGATQIRAGVMRPEIVIPIPDSDRLSQQRNVAEAGGGVLEEGSSVRIIRDPYFGVIGTVASLPSEPQVLESGSKARVLEVACGGGRRLIVPRANVEIIGAST
jgi:hypothetical protein